VLKTEIMRLAGYVACMGESIVQSLMEKPEGRRLLVRPTRRWKNNIKIDLIYIYWDGLDWVYLAQGRGRFRDFLNTVMNNLSN